MHGNIPTIYHTNIKKNLKKQKTMQEHPTNDYETKTHAIENVKNESNHIF
jgi:hypothetical protein